MDHYEDIKELHEQMLGGYISKRWKNPIFSYGWHAEMAEDVTSISLKRRTNRVSSYVIPEEFDRVRSRLEEGKDFSLRFGVEKKGKGNFGSRGDFCLLGASYTKTHRGTLTMYYRSLELFGGLVYDQAIIANIVDNLNLPLSKVVVMAGSCHSFALKGNSNEGLYKKLQKIYEEYE